jgi:hypothetical protein
MILNLPKVSLKAILFCSITLAVTTFACGPDEETQDEPLRQQSNESIQSIISSRNADSGIKASIELIGEGVPFDIEPITVSGKFSNCDESWVLSGSFLGRVYGPHECKTPLIYESVTFFVYDELITLTPDKIGIHDSRGHLWRFRVLDGIASLIGGHEKNFVGYEIKIESLDDYAVTRGIGQSGEACNGDVALYVSSNPLLGTIDIEFNAPYSGAIEDAQLSWITPVKEGVFVSFIDKKIRITLLHSGTWSVKGIRIDKGDSYCQLDRLDVSFNKKIRVLDVHVPVECSRTITDIEGEKYIVEGDCSWFGKIESQEDEQKYFCSSDYGLADCQGQVIYSANGLETFSVFSEDHGFGEDNLTSYLGNRVSCLQRTNETVYMFEDDAICFKSDGAFSCHKFGVPVEVALYSAAVPVLISHKDSWQEVACN